MIALGVFQLFSCRSTSGWRPYERPGADVMAQIAADAGLQDADGGHAKDGKCVACHQGCDDPHPGGRKASCVHCHGGDATQAEVAHKLKALLVDARVPAPAT